MVKSRRRRLGRISSLGEGPLYFPPEHFLCFPLWYPSSNSIREVKKEDRSRGLGVKERSRGRTIN